MSAAPVVFVVPALGVGGREAQVAALAADLARRGIAVELVCLAESYSRETFRAC